jgi:SAM-dependent methyltransferase
MSKADVAVAARDQDKVWDYFQTDGISIFDYAVPRLAYLFGEARRIAAGRRLRVLNIGVGNGWLERRSHREGWEAWGLDPNPAAIESLKRDGVNGVAGGIEAMPFRNESFHVVFSSEVFEHLLDDLLIRGLSEVSRVMQPGGMLIGSVPCREELELKKVVCPHCLHVHHAYGHHQSFDRARLESLFRGVGLESLYFRTRAFPGFARRDFKGKLKSSVWYVLGRMGAQAADAKIVFAARKPAGRPR